MVVRRPRKASSKAVLSKDARVRYTVRMRLRPWPVLVLLPAGACGGESFQAAPASDSGADVSTHDASDGGVDASKDALQDDTSVKDVSQEKSPEDAAKDVLADKNVVDVADAAVVDAVVVGPQCSGSGFLLTPNPPVSAGFNLRYEHNTGFVCVRFHISCGGQLLNVPAKPLPDTECVQAAHCWATTVTSCQPGDAKVTFVSEADHSGEPGSGCDQFAGKPGNEIASCTFTVLAK